MSRARDLADTISGDFALPAGALANAPNPIEAGTIAYLGMSTAPTGWLKANGAAVSRTTYADLFTAIGTIFGAGDGSTTFNLPDLRGEFPRGWDDGRGVDSARAFGSAQTHQLGSHSHTVGVRLSAGLGGNGSPASADNNANFNRATSAAGGTENGNETRPRNVALLACIKF